MRKKEANECTNLPQRHKDVPRSQYSSSSIHVPHPKLIPSHLHLLNVVDALMLRLKKKMMCLRSC